jgi:proteasome lid subunit RPN8/RPN11
VHLARRVEIDHSLAPVRMPARILHELCQHALETLPEECCGLLVGNSLERYRRIVRCRNDMTALHHLDPTVYPRDGRAAFYMNEHDYMKAWSAAQEAGESVTAVYHSHVGAGAYLSEMDLAYAENPFFPFPHADQIVLPVFDRTVHDIGVFRRTGSCFTGHPIERVDS